MQQTFEGRERHQHEVVYREDGALRTWTFYSWYPNMSEAEASRRLNRRRGSHRTVIQVISQPRVRSLKEV